MLPRAFYRVEEVDEFVCIHDQKRVAMSVTNDAHNVVADLVEAGFDFTDRKLIYGPNQIIGTPDFGWDEIKVKGNKFDGIVPHDAPSRDALIAKLRGR